MLSPSSPQPAQDGGRTRSTSRRRPARRAGGGGGPRRHGSGTRSPAPAARFPAAHGTVHRPPLRGRRPLTPGRGRSRPGRRPPQPVPQPVRSRARLQHHRVARQRPSRRSCRPAAPARPSLPRQAMPIQGRSPEIGLITRRVPSGASGPRKMASIAKRMKSMWMLPVPSARGRSGWQRRPAHQAGEARAERVGHLQRRREDRAAGAVDGAEETAGPAAPGDPGPRLPSIRQLVARERARISIRARLPLGRPPAGPSSASGRGSRSAPRPRRPVHRRAR